jgi:hypothetical protein
MLKLVGAALAVAFLVLGALESRAGVNCTTTRVGNTTYTHCN